MNAQTAFYDLKNWRYHAVDKGGKNTLEIFPEKKLAQALEEEGFSLTGFSLVMTASGYEQINPGEEDLAPGDVIEELFGGELDEGLEFEDRLMRLFYSVELLRRNPAGTLVTYKTKEDWVCDPRDRQADFKQVQQLHEAVFFHLNRLGCPLVERPFDRADYTAFRERVGLEDSRQARAVWASSRGAQAKKRD